jgi:HlyD family secretion protein
MKRVIWGVVLLLVVAGAVYSLRPQPVAVEMGTPERRTVNAFIAEEAKTRLRETYTVDMPVNGTLQRIALEVGDVVSKGDVVARVDDHDLRQRVRGLEAQIAQVRAQITGVDVSKPKTEDLVSAEVRISEAKDALQIAERALEIARIERSEAAREFERVQELRKEGVASQSQLDNAQDALDASAKNLERLRLSVDAARKGLRLAELSSSRVEGSVDDNEYMRDMYQAQIESLEAELAVARADLEKTEMRAPVNGPILTKMVQDRRVMPAGTPLLEIGDLSTIEIECDVLSEEVGRVGVGDSVEIYGKAVGEETLPGEVSRIYPAAFQKISALGIEQQRVKVIIAFDNTGPDLRAGTRLDVRIITDAAEEVLAVPERTIFRRDGAWHVFTVAGSRASLQPVTVGIKNDTWAEIREGITPDTRLVLEPTNQLEDGARVTEK